jgi:hypothetical protein
MELNTEKIDNELKRLGKSRAWLAHKIGISRQLLYYRLDKRIFIGVEDIAKALDFYDGKDLIR